jgi:hypothetical protein
MAAKQPLWQGLIAQVISGRLAYCQIDVIDVHQKKKALSACPLVRGAFFYIYLAIYFGLFER